MIHPCSYQGGHQERVESFEDDFSDCNVLAKVMKQIAPKQTDGIDSVTQESDKFEVCMNILGDKALTRN
jgi:hypothetical protein